MAGKNAFYLLFAYEQTYLHTPSYSTTAVEGTVDVRPIITQLTDLKQFFDYETYKYYYDKRNLDSFVKTIKGGFTEKRAFMRKLHNNLKANNWNAKKAFTGSTTIGGVPVNDETFSYLSVHNTVCPADKNAILDMGAMRVAYPVFSSDVLKPTIKAVHDWFTRNRVPGRIYNWNPKHGEFGKGNRPGESALLGSRQEAAKLLPAAIGMKGRKDLYLFDKQYAKYMRFMPENVADTYHSFHIDTVQIDSKIREKVLDKLSKI